MDIFHATSSLVYYMNIVILDDFMITNVNPEDDLTYTLKYNIIFDAVRLIVIVTYINTTVVDHMTRTYSSCWSHDPYL